MRLVDADTLIEDLKQLVKYQCGVQQSAIIGVIYTISKRKTIDPVKHGKWEFGRQHGASGYWCTNCRCGFTGENAEWMAREHDYCPKCGADMRGDQE